MHARHKVAKLGEARNLYLKHPEGLSDIELARRLGVDRSSAFRYRRDLGATRVAPGRYTLLPTPDDIELALTILARASHMV